MSYTSPRSPLSPKAAWPALTAADLIPAAKAVLAIQRGEPCRATLEAAAARLSDATAAHMHAERTGDREAIQRAAAHRLRAWQADAAAARDYEAARLAGLSEAERQHEDDDRQAGGEYPTY